MKDKVKKGDCKFTGNIRKLLLLGKLIHTQSKICTVIYIRSCNMTFWQLGNSD